MSDRVRRIGLIGFMGTGKTVVGGVLAERIGLDFIDTDSIIESRTGTSIRQIFTNEGEEHFRELEHEVVKEVCTVKSAVISFGGGVLLNPVNAAMISESTFVVLLRSPIDTLLSRTSNGDTRPLLVVERNDLRERIQTLISQREVQYNKAADLVIETTDSGVDEIVETIIRRMDV